MVSGDTGPTHIAAAVGTPIVGIFGPTRPSRNGPWSPDDVTVSRDEVCQCHHLRRCRSRRMCLLDIEVDEVLDAVERRLAAATSARMSDRRCVDRRAGTARALRVALGFAFGALVLWLAEPTAAIGDGRRARSRCVGEAIRIWAAGHLHKAREVTSSGPYRWSAHPLYVGSSVMGVGLAIASGSVIVAALIAVYLIVALTAAAKTEEAFLRRTFGDEYDRIAQGAAPIERREGPAVQLGAGDRRITSIARSIGLVLAMLLLALKAARNV